MEAVLAFAAALVALRLAGLLASRWRARRRPELAAWSASLLCYGLAAGALAWGTAAGWNEHSFRVYYLFGGLLTAPLLGLGSLLLAGKRWAVGPTLVYVGLALGVSIAVPLTDVVSRAEIPAAQDHLAFFPARVVAIAGNSLGTLAVVAVALMTLRARPLGNVLILAGVTVAALGSALGGLGGGGASVSVAVAVVLLYLGFVAPRSRPLAFRRKRP